MLPAGRQVRWLAIGTVAVGLFWILRVSTPWRDQRPPANLLVEQTMKLTTPNEFVLDLKGEMLVRRRAFYYVLQKITKRAIAAGRLRDTR